MKKETLRKVTGEMSEYLKKAITYAQQCHVGTNHLYDNSPYFYHLQGVAAIAERFIEYIPSELRESVLAASWCHDTIEDTRQTYNDVKKAIGEQAAEIVYALTNEKGKNRKQRANEKYYSEMKMVPGAVFVKLCDRLSNIIHSQNNASSMLSVYWKEHLFFEKMLSDGEYEDIWKEMNEYLNK